MFAWWWFVFPHQKAATTPLLHKPASVKKPHVAKWWVVVPRACPASLPPAEILQSTVDVRQVGLWPTSLRHQLQVWLVNQRVSKVFLLNHWLLPAGLLLCLQQFPGCCFSLTAPLQTLSGLLLYLQWRSLRLKSPGGFGDTLIKPCGRWSHFYIVLCVSELC